MKKYSDVDQKQLIEEFIKRYKKQLPILNGDIDYCSAVIRNSHNNKRRNEIIDEVYYATGLFEDDENPYLGFTNFIENKYGLDLNILEVGGGIFPALSDAISTKQLKINKGTITVYDPLLAVKKLKNIRLIKDKFTNSTNIKNYDLIIGIKPCNITNQLITKSTAENKNFMIYPCDCTHHISFDEFDDVSIKEWHDYIYNLCKQDSKKIDVDYLSKTYKYPNPIFSYKK